MRRVALVLLGIAILACGVAGFVKTAYFTKAAWVFGSSDKIEPNRREGGIANQVDSRGGIEKGASATRDESSDLKSGLHGMGSSTSDGINLVNVGHFTLIMVAFAFGTASVASLTKWRNRKSRIVKGQPL